MAIKEIKKPLEEIPEVTKDLSKEEIKIDKSVKTFVEIIPPFLSPNSKTFIAISGNEYMIDIDSDNIGLIPVTHEKKKEIIEYLETQKWRLK